MYVIKGLMNPYENLLQRGLYGFIGPLKGLYEHSLGGARLGGVKILRPPQDDQNHYHDHIVSNEPGQLTLRTD